MNIQSPDRGPGKPVPGIQSDHPPPGLYFIHKLFIPLLLSTLITIFALLPRLTFSQIHCGEWDLVQPPNGSLAIINIEARSTDDAWAIAYLNPDPKDMIHWNGVQWSRVPTADSCSGYSALSIEALDLVGPEQVLVAARASTGPFSTDQLLLFWNGQSWDNCHSLTLQPNIMGAPRNGAPNAIVALAPDDAWILGAAPGSGDATGEGYLTLHWDGSGLAEVSTSGGPGNASKSFRDGVGFQSNDIWAVGQYRIIGQGTPGYHASTYHYDGSNWNYIPNPAETLCCQSTDLNTVAGVASDDVWAAGSWGADPLFMHWDGSSWTIVPPPAGATGNIYEMVAIASDDVWAVDALDNTGKGKFYHWDGSSWSVVPGQEIPGAVGVERHGGLAATGPCEVWAVGSYNFGTNPVSPLIERLQDRLSPAPENELPEFAGIAQVAPNPFNPRVEIAINLDRAGPANLAVHDLRGRLVQTIHQGELAAGSHTLAWNGTDSQGRPVTSGSYIVSFLGNGKHDSRKVVLLK